NVGIRAVGQSTPHYCRKGVNHVAKLFFTLAKSLFCPLRVVDVESNSYPIQESSITRQQRFNPAEKQAVPAFGVSSSKTHLTRTAGTHAGWHGSTQLGRIL